MLARRAGLSRPCIATRAAGDGRTPVFISGELFAIGEPFEDLRGQGPAQHGPWHAEECSQHAFCALKYGREEG